MRNKLFTLVLILATLFISSTVSALGIYYPTDGIYSIQPKFAPDKELSVQGHASNWGANVIIENLNSGWQKWKIQRIPGTHFYSIVAVSSNLAIDVANAQASDGANIATWPFLEGRQNQFAFFDAGGGCYVIKANLDGNFVLDVERAENRAGANVLSWSFHGGDNQLWRLVMIRRLPEFQSYNKRATQKVTAYVMPDLQARSGNEWVDAGDNVTVLREEDNAYLVRYPVSGGTKTRWVNKNEIFSGSTPNSGNVNMQGNEFTWPVPGYYKINTTYTYSSGKVHSSRYTYNGRACGIDISVPVGTEVRAVADGVIVNQINRGSESFGKWLEIRHNDGTCSVYAHLSDYSMVRQGQRVSKGDLIARSGNTGNSSGPHLHFELSGHDTYQYFKNLGVIK